MTVRHLEQVIKWVGSKPVTTYTEIITKEAVAELPLAVLGTKYQRTPLEIELGIDEDLEGLTLAEVMMLRVGRSAARGNQWAVREMMDRVLGKPKSTAEVTSVKINYEDYLKKIALKDADFTVVDDVDNL